MRGTATAQQSLRFEDNIGLVHMQAKFGYRWAQAAGGQTLDYEDLFQEASIAFLLAAQGYDPDTGLKFSAYYTKVAFSQFRRAISVATGVKNLREEQRAEIAERRQENGRRGAAGLAPLPDCKFGLRPLCFSELDFPDDSGPFIDSVPSEYHSPEEILQHKQELQQVHSQLSPLAALVLEWLRDPPPELMRELNCQMAHVEQCRAHGERTHGLRDGLSISAIAKFLKVLGADISKGELALVKRELLDAAKTLEAA